MTKTVRKWPQTLERNHPMAKITFLATEGCLFSGISGLIDAFSIANLWQCSMNKNAHQPLFETEIVTVDGNPFTASGNIYIHAHRSIDHVAETDMIVIPPFLPHMEPLPKHTDHLLAWLVSRYKRGALVGALCTGTFMLAETGLLDHKIATTNWHFARLFRQRYPRVRLKPERMLTEESGLICSGAATAALNLTLLVVERFGSQALASVCAKALLVDPNRESQAPYVISEPRRNHGDEKIFKAQAWIRSNFNKPIAIDTIAAHVGISPRHFKRRFKMAAGVPPLGYLQQIRIDAAKKRLETTRDTIAEITWHIGYEDSSSFRRLFKKSTGLSPREYRDKFARLTRP
jgi:transcriptional regulator GlxA family with amidase domain